MKFLFKMLATAALAVSLTDAEDGIRFGPWCGGPHSEFYTGEDKVFPGQKVVEVRLFGAERVDGVFFRTTIPGSSTDSHWTIGGNGGDPVSLVLREGEHITSVEYHTDKHNGHTRLFFLGLTTNKNATKSVGQRSGEAFYDEAPFGYQLSALYGFHGDEIDMAGAIWTSIDVKPQIVAIVP